MKKHPFLNLSALLLCFSFTASFAFSQVVEERIYGKDNPFTIQELPEGKLKAKLVTLNPESKEKAMRWLNGLTFKAFDAAEHMRVDNDGGIFTICPDDHGNCDGHSHAIESIAQAAPAPVTGSPGSEKVSVSINTPPIYSSKPDADYHLYLDFNGAVVTGKAWNTSYGVTSWNCGAWNLDANSSTFSDLEQAKMKEIWQRMAEDYAPFNINVTTNVAYDPINYTGDKNKVAWLLFTDTTDTNNKACPHYGSGGVAYVGVFGRTDYFSTYQPAWVTPADTIAYMAEAGSHEIGHNLGLSHDGSTTAGYYAGHGNNDISWNPIMGAALRNVSQWSKGEYYKANQFQDDLGIITSRVPYRIDDHGDTPGSATPLTIVNGTDIIATTPDDDPSNSNPANKGIIGKHGDIDVFSFETGAGSVTLNVNPWKQSEGTFGGNLDVLMELYDDQGALVASANPAIQTRATIQTTLAAGIYYIYVKNSGAGSPSSATPSGYTDYGSLGQYFISGTVIEGTPRLRVYSINPNVGGTGTTVNVGITGTLFVATPTVKLTKTGYSDILGTNVSWTDSQNLTCDFDLTGAVLGDWNVVVTNPDLESATLPLSFTVELPKVDFYKETFDVPDAFVLLDKGWKTYTTTEAAPLWVVDPNSSQTANNSVFASCPSVVSTKYLESPSMPIPANAIDLRFSFWHDCDLEAGYDGGTLEFSLDDGLTWFNVNSSDSGAGFESNGYNKIISSGYRSPIAGQYAWSGDSNGYIESVILITDSAKYSGKSLKARWLLASDNFAVSTGWNIDTVEITGSIYVAPGDPNVNDLNVATAADLTFVGTHGGPFGPTPQSYTLTNSGLTALKWTASKGTSWVTLSASSGNLGAGESITLYASINSNALALPVGIHADTISITNLSKLDDVITRGVSVEVNAIPATVTITNLLKTYNGTPQAVTVTTNPTGLPVDVTYNGSPTAPTNAGSYPVVATINHARYAGSASGTLVIAKANPVVTKWPTAAAIPVGQPVSSATLSGSTTSVAGSFSYNSPATVLALGTHSVPVTFTPSDTTNYASVSGTVNVVVYPVADLVRTTVSNVSNSGWTTVTHGKTYVSPVIVATPIYTNSTLPPVVTRIRNVTATGFELKLDRADGLTTPVTMSVSVVAVNEGVYTVAQQGVKMEAVKYTSTLTASGTGAWNAEARTYQNTYTKPVVVGQVMSSNDARWSAFWSRGSQATAPISATSLNIGKHVGLDPAKTRASETIGYIVVESGTGTINGVRYQAAVGTDIVRSFGDAATPYKYTLSGLTSVSAAALSQTGMDGTEGSWAVLSGAPALTTTALKLHVAEDGFNNTLRKHTTEQVAFIVFE